MKKVLIAVALALAVSTLYVRAQDAGGAPKRPPGGPHLLPPHAAEHLNLTDDQKKQIADLEAEVKAKIEKILTADQLKQLKEMRPPQRQGGKGDKSSKRGEGAPEDMPPGPPPGDEPNQ